MFLRIVLCVSLTSILNVAGQKALLRNVTASNVRAENVPQVLEEISERRRDWLLMQMMPNLPDLNYTVHFLSTGSRVPGEIPSFK